MFSDLLLYEFAINAIYLSILDYHLIAEFYLKNLNAKVCSDVYTVNHFNRHLPTDQKKYNCGY